MSAGRVLAGGLANDPHANLAVTTYNARQLTALAVVGRKPLLGENRARLRRSTTPNQPCLRSSLAARVRLTIKSWLSLPEFDGTVDEATGRCGRSIRSPFRTKRPIVRHV